MLEYLFQNVIEISTGLSIVLIAIFIFMPFIKKRYSPRWRYIVWLVIGVRLLIPFRFENKAAIFQIKIPAETISVKEDNAQDKVQTQIEEQEHVIVKQEETQSVEAHKEDIKQPVSRLEICSLIWLVGMLSFNLYMWVMYRGHKKQLNRWGRRVEDERIISIYESLGEELQLTRKPELKYCRKQNSPLLIGILKPVIFIPHKNYEDKALELILKHELIHYKHKDLSYKLTLLLARGMHWFNPLVHLFAQGAEQDLEIICDEAVLRKENVQAKKYYMENILQMIHEANFSSEILTTQFKGGKHMLRERFTSILDDRKKKKGMFTLGIALAVIIGAGMIIAFENKQEAIATDNIDTISEANSGISQDNNSSVSENTKIIDIKGCSIKVPASWQVTNGKNDIFYLEAEGHRIGGIKLMEDSSKPVQLGNVFELPINAEKPNVILGQGEERYMTIDYTAFSDAPYVQYVFMDLSNPPPYAYEIYFDTTYVDRETITTVLGTFSEPELQGNAPGKIRKALNLKEAKKTAVCKVLREDGQEETFNIQKLEAFIKGMQQGQAGSVEIIQYIETDGEAVIKDWSVLTFDGKEGSYYGYYALESGEYTYDNIPTRFKEIQKKQYENDKFEKIISYRLDGSMRLLGVTEKPELLTMTAEEDKIYVAYKKDLDDKHLKGLEPITVAKFYLLACIENDNDVRYALYEPYEEGEWGWSKEEDEKYSQEESKLSTYERIKDIRNLVNGTFVLQDARHGYIAYDNYDADGNAISMGFQMIKTSDDIWKVCFTPIQ